MFGLKVITSKRFKELIKVDLKVYDLRKELIKSWREINKLEKNKMEIISKSDLRGYYRTKLITESNLKIQSLEQEKNTIIKELNRYKAYQEGLNSTIQNLKEVNEKKQKEELNKSPNLPQKNRCNICNKAYFITVKKFQNFKNKRKEIVSVCEDCVKLHKLNLKEK